jgi:Xaa-Pro dipeptidase
VHHDIDKLMKPGMNLRAASELTWRIPDAFVKNRYSSVAHCVGLCDE